jgi:hypothetical protein
MEQFKPKAKPSNKLVIGDQEFSIDWPTYNFRDADPGFNAYLETCTVHSGGRCGPGGAPYEPAKGLEGKTKRYRPRHYTEKRSPALAKALVKQFVVHLDGCINAEMCWNVLHNERGLSCHFILDNDGTIYQTLDLIDCAYHACGLNETSIGIEICNRGNAALYPNDYARQNMKRDVVVCEVNHEKYVAFDFTPEQYEGMVHLGKALARYLPGIKLSYPQTSGGEPIWNTLDPTDTTNVRLRESYSGYVGHYHLTTQKWDPGPFDFKKFIGKLSGHRVFPIGLHDKGGNEKNEVPDPPGDKGDRTAYAAAFQPYYDNNEFKGSGGGYYPVGPLEATRLWHGGIHLHAEPGTKILSPFAGRVVVARNRPEEGGIGSTNFVLLQHSLPVAGEQLNFFSLYYHLQHVRDSLKKENRPKWMSNEAWLEGEPGKTIDLGSGEPVQAGEIIGRIGVAGTDPPEGQIHWEIFAIDNHAVSKIDNGKFWTLVSGQADQRFCSNRDILDKIDIQPKDGLLSHDEILDAYQANTDFREFTHHVIAQHYSEWGDNPSWEASLQSAQEFAKHKAEASKLYHEQIEPGLWLTAERAQKLGMPWPPQVYTYHPVSFLMWVNQLMGSAETSSVRKATQSDYATASRSGMVDFDDKQGIAALEAKLDLEPPAKQIGLPEMVDGYGD